MNSESIIQAFGGGPVGFIIAGLVGAVIWLAISKERIQESRLNDMREANKAHREQADQFQRALQAITDAWRGERR